VTRCLKFLFNTRFAVLKFTPQVFR
jgi:hypothetical protein